MKPSDFIHPEDAAAQRPATPPSLVRSIECTPFYLGNVGIPLPLILREAA